MLDVLETIIARLETAIEAEDAFIAEAISARQIGQSGDHWQPRYRLVERLRVVRTLRAVALDFADDRNAGKSREATP